MDKRSKNCRTPQKRISPGITLGLCGGGAPKALKKLPPPPKKPPQTFLKEILRKTYLKNKSAAPRRLKFPKESQFLFHPPTFFFGGGFSPTPIGWSLKSFFFLWGFMWYSCASHTATHWARDPYVQIYIISQPCGPDSLSGPKLSNGCFQDQCPRELKHWYVVKVEAEQECIVEGQDRGRFDSIENPKKESISSHGQVHSKCVLRLPLRHFDTQLMLSGLKSCRT